ncbi:hypothetical protein KW785_00605 [Candidatus Parcubacteria bacterium]|nr:hypothetical protein [Candidatus Parcubacteria bacterium]
MKTELWSIGFETIKELETEEGILASDKQEIFGCIFGRDSLITSLKLLKTYNKTKDPYFLLLVKKILRNLAKLQGQDFNIESGEEPGKIIHEFRETGHQHLTGRVERPWFLYPDNAMKNYDSVDSTPLFLIAVARYVQQSGDTQFAEEVRPNVEMALAWVLGSMKGDRLGFLSYQFHPDRKHGGLVTQSWMDSHESIFHEDGAPTPYPIAPAEVQAYAYLALRLWKHDDAVKSLKENFHKHFVFDDEECLIAFGLDGHGKPMLSARSSMGHLLWASLNSDLDGVLDCILDKAYLPRLAQRIMLPDLFEPKAGVRTLSKKSRCFDPLSYHNGSIWPHDTAMIAEGLANFGFAHEAAEMRASLWYAWDFFKTPIELFTYTDKGYREYESAHGQRACKKQAWSAASILSEL